MTTSFLDDLNPEQREAAQALEGPLLILAGAGTGKTKTVTYRAANLLAHGVAAERILCVTFTNKAAGEMRERIRALAGGAARGMVVSTFHALGARVLREEAETLGYGRDFTIYDTSDQFALLRKVAREVRLGNETLALKAIQAGLSRAKPAGLLPAALADAADVDDVDETVVVAYRRYQEFLKSYNAVDFDDLLLLVLRLFREHPAALAKAQRRFQSVMIDEYQDTNAVQFEIARLLVASHGNLCAVGDDDQSIYAWRGAVRENILTFHRRFPGARVVTLVRNYRSPESILAVANAVIRPSPGRAPKELRSTLGPGEKVQLLVSDDDRDEARRVVDLIRMRRAADPRGRYGDHAVLFRSSRLMRLFEEKLRLEGIPYVLIGGQRFYDRREIKDLFAYLALLENPRDQVSALRVINLPPRGIGRGTVEKLVKHASRAGKTLTEVCADPGRVDGLGPKEAAAARGFAQVLQKYRAMSRERPIAETLAALVEEIDYRAELARDADSPADAERRANGVRELFESIAAFERERPAATLRDFLAASTLASDADEEKKTLQPTHVTLITMHSCKGLEFPHVYVAGCEEGILPHQRSLDEAEADESDVDVTVDEERRLFYVAITRAMRRCTISRCRARASRGGRVTPRLPSRFLGDVPPGLLADAGIEVNRPATAEEQRAALERMLGAMSRRSPGGGHKPPP
ncbi:MAG: UvrD-helicase domain-containing protein [Planctomycetes bacterium]|nr:UvrD-helicase domain-containing protein [Planctomycetota bacterium]